MQHQEQQPTSQPAAVPDEAQAEAASPTAATRDNNRPISTVRSGPIGVSIWQNVNQAGEERIGFTFSRAWKSQEGDTGYSQTFYAGNRDDLHTAIDQACDQAQAIERATERRIERLSQEVSEGASE